MKTVVWLPTMDPSAVRDGTLGSALELAAAASDQPPAGLILRSPGVRLEAAAFAALGLAEVTTVEVPALTAGEPPDFHGLGLLLAAALDAMGAQLVITCPVPGRAGLEAVAAAIGSQLDWPVVFGVERGSAEDGVAEIELRFGGRWRKLRLPLPAILVTAGVPGRYPSPAPLPSCVLATLTPAELHVPVGKLRPTSFASGVAFASRPERTRTVTSADALVDGWLRDQG